MSAPLRPASTVLLLRDSASGALEVWLMERNRTVAFMASAWVFPGGRVDEGDELLPAIAEPDEVALLAIPRAFWTAAARELEEEANVRLGGPDGYDLAALKVWSHWITPEVEPRRFDTWFFAAALPIGAEPQVDGGEAVKGGWYSPAEAISLAGRGELPVAPPTLRTLHELLPYETAAAALGAVRRTPAICPKFKRDDDGLLFVLLPGDPEHSSEEAVDPPFRYVFEAGRWWAKDRPPVVRPAVDGGEA